MNKNMGIKYKYPSDEAEIQALYKLTQNKEIISWIGGGIIPPILREAAKKKEIIIAKDEERVVGFIKYHRCKDGYTTIYERGVDPEYRGRKIAQSLQSLLTPPIRAKCKPENIRIQGLYRKMGMRLDKIEVIKAKGRKPYMIYVFTSK